MSKKIGILTYHRGPNYGGFLQAWHLREAIRSLGFDADVVNYQNAKQAATERNTLKGLHPRQIWTYLTGIMKSRPFREPVAELSQQAHTTDVSRVDWDRYDRIVVGSDVIWDFTQQEAGSDPAFYAATPSQEGPGFLAYAASCGATPASVETVPDFVEQGLRKFSAIAARDSNTASLVERLTGTLPEIVCDPTWLGDDPKAGRSQVEKLPENYIVIYGISTHDPRARIARAFCDREKLPLISAGTPCRLAHRVLRSLDPFQWAEVIGRSKGVITCTLHGSHYAIKYGRPMAFVESPSSLLKAREAIERAGRTPHSITQDETFDEDYLRRCLLTEPITSGVPDDWKADSLSWLKAQLEKC